MKIVIKENMSQLNEKQQEEIWKLSRTNEVFEEDVNGVLWRILDLTNDESEGVVLRVREDKKDESK